MIWMLFKFFLISMTGSCIFVYAWFYLIREERRILDKIQFWLYSILMAVLFSALFLPFILRKFL